MGLIYKISLHLLSVNVTPLDNVTEVRNNTPKKWLSTCFLILKMRCAQLCVVPDWHTLSAGEPSLP